MTRGLGRQYLARGETCDKSVGADNRPRYGEHRDSLEFGRDHLKITTGGRGRAFD